MFGKQFFLSLIIINTFFWLSYRMQSSISTYDTLDIFLSWIFAIFLLIYNRQHSDKKEL